MTTIQQVDMTGVRKRLEALDKKILIRTFASYQKSLLRDMRDGVRYLAPKQNQMLTQAMGNADAIIRGTNGAKQKNAEHAARAQSRLSTHIQDMEHQTALMNYFAKRIKKHDQTAQKMAVSPAVRKRVVEDFVSVIHEVAKWASDKEQISAQKVADAIRTGGLFTSGTSPKQRTETTDKLKLVGHIPQLEYILSGGVKRNRQRPEAIARGIQRAAGVSNG